VYGTDSVHVRSLTREVEQMREKYAAINVSDWMGAISTGALLNLIR